MSGACSTAETCESPVDDTQLTVQFKQDSYEVIEGCTVEVTVTLSRDPGHGV